MKKIIIGILLFPMLVFISACDGGYSGSKIDFKSHIDSHSMTIKLDSKIANFYYGDILNPFLGRSTFKTKTKVGITELNNEIIENNSHVEVAYLKSDIIVLFEKTKEGKTYSYYIKYLEEKDNRNFYIAGEMGFSFESHSDDYNYVKLILPYHMIEDDDFDKAILNSNELKFDKEYQISNEYDIDSFVNYYNNIGWINFSKENNIISVSSINYIQSTTHNYTYLDTFIIDFNEAGKIKIMVKTG